MATDCSSKQQKVIIVSSFKALLLLITFTLKMKFCSFFVACLTVTTVSSFTLNEGNNKFKLLTGTTSTTDKQGCSPEHQPTRADFVRQSAMTVAVTAIGSSIFGVEPAIARGRATLEFAYEKYTPRIEAGGVFYKNKLKTLIANNDFAGIKRALQEPPKKSKEDRAKVDGGISERASQAGEFSDSRVVVAMDLFAAQFSDNSISPKTKAMKTEVDEIRSIIQQMESLAKQGLGEESAGGGFLGIGKKQLSKSEISNKLKELYIAGGTAYNKYVFAANDGLPVTLNKLPYL